MNVPASMRAAFEHERSQHMTATACDARAAATVCMSRVESLVKQVEQLAATVQGLQADNVKLNKALEDSRKAYRELTQK